MSGDGPFDVAVLLEVEDENRHLGLLAQTDGGHIHHLQIIAEHLMICQLFVAHGVGIDLRRRAVNTIYLRSLEENVRLQFAGAESGGSIRRYERIAGAARENDDSSLLQMAI